jgi:hypothetical protein
LFVVEGVRGYGGGLVEPVRGVEVAEVCVVILLLISSERAWLLEWGGYCEGGW